MNWKDRLSYCKDRIKNNWRTILLWQICILLALMWAAAAFGKLTDMEEFYSQLGKSPLLQGFEEVIRWMLPYGELLLVFILIYPASRLLGLYTSTFLFSLFIAYIIAILKFSDYDVPCACSGFTEKLSWKEHLVFNSICLSISIVGILIQQGIKKHSAFKAHVSF